MSQPAYESLTDKLHRLREMKLTMRALAAQADQAKRDHDAFQREVFDDMRAENVYGHKTNMARFDAKSTIYADVTDQEAFSAWCAERDLEDEFIKDAPQKARLNEYVRAALDNGEELPSGVSWRSQDYISITENKD